MRILAVTIQNLASLQGRHEIRFDSGPLENTGLFAITGPTGAGKSTILDAICLALYNRTPRLCNQGGVEVGPPNEERLRDNDARSLISRGCAEGWAEVEYRGQDGEIYVSIWRAQRARQKVSGRFQTAQMILKRKRDGQHVASKLTEVTSCNEQYLRLNFHQFTRSVMLAQGEFAAFLKANADDRANLLERMTGTDLYSALSIRAHEEAKRKHDALACLQQKAAASPPLAHDARIELEGRLVQLENDRQRFDTLIKQLEQAQEWYRQLSEVDSRIQKAVEKAESADRTVSENVHCWERLQQIEDAERHRAKLEAVISRSEALSKHEAQLLTAKNNLETALADLAQREAEETKAKLRFDSSETARHAKQPELNEARQQDALIENLERQVQEAQQILAEAQDAHAKAITARTILLEHRDAAKVSLISLMAELASQAELAPIAEGWHGLRDVLVQLAKVEGGGRSSAEQLQQLSDELRDLRAREEETLQAIEHRTAELQAAETTLGVAEAESSALDPAAIRWKRDQKEDRLKILQVLSDLVGTGIATRDLRVAHQQRFNDLKAEAARAEQRAKEKQSQATLLMVRINQTQRMRDQLSMTLSLEDHRADLVEGEACPLCGSKEHPYVGQAPETSAMAPLECELTNLSAELLNAQEAAAVAGNDAHHHHTQADEAGDASNALALKLEDYQKQWLAALSQENELELPEKVTDSGAIGKLKDYKEAVEADLDRLKAEQDRCEFLQQAKIRAMDARETARQVAEVARQAHETLKSKLSQVEQDQAVANAQYNTAVRTITEDLLPAAARLLGEAESWRSDHAADPLAFLESLQMRVDRFQTLKFEQKGIERELVEQEIQIGPADVRVADAHGRVTHQETETKRIVADLFRKQEARSRLLGGRPVGEIERELDRAYLEAKQTHAETVKKHQEAAQVHVQRLTELDGLHQAIADDSLALAKAEGELARSLADLVISKDELQSRLSHSPQWIQDERIRLDEIKATATAAHTELETHKSSRGELAAKALTEFSEEELTSQMEAAIARRELVNDDREQARTELRVDDQCRAQLQEFKGELEVAEQDASIWAKLDDVIGSATGSKFKRYAQSLTLDTLLVHANFQLKDLAPRYRLQRIPDADLDLQIIDVHMMDEVRSLHTLSGGETFLASLALSLGMAAMASRHTRIDTLFIDEGFGTLDEDTLNTALEALEALQSSGKQVGMISHVPGLAQRIGAGVSVEAMGTGRSRVQVYSR